MKFSRKPLALLLSAAMITSLSALPACQAAQAAEYETKGATSFSFGESAITAKDGEYSGYEIDGTALSITESGTYVISGSCSDGSVKVKKGVTDVTLVLDGLNLTSSDTAPITCAKSTEVTIIAQWGSVNTLTDSEYNNDETHTDNLNAENAVIKCKDGSKVTIGGSGTINVNANGKNGIKGGLTTAEEGEASLTVEDLTLNINSTVNDGLKSDQELNILSGNITVSAVSDAIKSDYVLNIGAEGTEGPVIKATSDDEGIEAATLNIYSGDVYVKAVDDGLNAANKDLTDYTYSCNIYGGNIYIDASADGIDSNGNLNVSGGDIIIFSASEGDNAPLDCDGEFNLTGGTVLAVGSGLMPLLPTSASQPYVSFGSSGMGGMRMFNGGNMGSSPENLGEFRNNMGIGRNNFDKNGKNMGNYSTDMTPPEGINMGTPPDNSKMGNPPDNSIVFRGEMGNSFDTSGNFDKNMGITPENMSFGNGGNLISINSGDTITITDESGKTLATEKALRTANYVFFTSDSLESGKTYSLKVNGSEAAAAQATSQGGRVPGQPGGTAQVQTSGGEALSEENHPSSNDVRLSPKCL